MKINNKKLIIALILLFAACLVASILLYINHSWINKGKESRRILSGAALDFIVTKESDSHHGTNYVISENHQNKGVVDWVKQKLTFESEQKNKLFTDLENQCKLDDGGLIYKPFNEKKEANNIFEDISFYIKSHEKECGHVKHFDIEQEKVNVDLIRKYIGNDNSWSYIGKSIRSGAYYFIDNKAMLNGAFINASLLSINQSWDYINGIYYIAKNTVYAIDCKHARANVIAAQLIDDNGVVVGAAMNSVWFPKHFDYDSILYDYAREMCEKANFKW